MNNPLKNLTLPKKIKYSNTEYGRYRLNHNEMKFLEKEDSYLLLDIYEECKNNQVVFVEQVVIDSRMNDGDCAIVGSECRPNDINKDKCKQADLMYLFVANQQNMGAYCYAYEMKHCVGNSENVIFEMLDQCAFTCFFCKQLYEKSCYSEKNINGIFSPLKYYVGVITEKFDKEVLLNNWIIPKQNSLFTTTPQNFFEQKLQTQQNETKKNLKILQNFYDGHAIINGMDIPFDVRFFDNQRKIMRFVNGILQ